MIHRCFSDQKTAFSLLFVHFLCDLAICMKDPKSFCDTLNEKYKLKLKGVGPISYHLGCGYTRDEDGTLVADPRK